MSFKTALADMLLLFPIAIVSCYFVLHYLIPKLLFTKRLIFFLICIFLLAVINGAYNVFMFEHVIIPRRTIIGLQFVKTTTWSLASINSSYIYFLTVGSAISIKLSKVWYFQQLKIFELGSTIERFKDFPNQGQPGNFILSFMKRVLYKIHESHIAVQWEKTSRLIKHALQESNSKIIDVNEELQALSDYVDVNQTVSDMPITIDIHNTSSFSYKLPAGLLVNIIEIFLHEHLQHKKKDLLNVIITIDRADISLQIVSKESDQHLFLSAEFQAKLALTEQKLKLYYSKNYHLQMITKNDSARLLLNISMDKIIYANSLY